MALNTISNDFGISSQNKMGKVETGQCMRLPIYTLAKHEYFLDGYKSCRNTSLFFRHSFSGKESSIGATISLIEGYQFVSLYYTATLPTTGEEMKVEDHFPLVTTPCYFGGIRYWFICTHENDGKACGRRVGVLYMKGHQFACRHCHDLTYNSRKISGRFKDAGNIISIPDLEEAESQVKRTHYAGKPTRKYLRYLCMEHKFKRNWFMNVMTIQEMREEQNTRQYEKALR